MICITCWLPYSAKALTQGIVVGEKAVKVCGHRVMLRLKFSEWRWERAVAGGQAVEGAGEGGVVGQEAGERGGEVFVGSGDAVVVVRESLVLRLEVGEDGGKAVVVGGETAVVRHRRLKTTAWAKRFLYSAPMTFWLLTEGIVVGD